MYKSLLATSVASALLLGSALGASAEESTFEMMALREKGVGPAIGTIHVAEEADGVTMHIDLKDLPPGPNRIFVHDAGDCGLPRAELRSNAVAVVDVGINEDGAEELKTTVRVPGAKLDDFSAKALLIRRGSESTEATPEQTGIQRLVACGVGK